MCVSQENWKYTHHTPACITHTYNGFEMAKVTVDVVVEAVNILSACRLSVWLAIQIVLLTPHTYISHTISGGGSCTIRWVCKTSER